MSISDGALQALAKICEHKAADPAGNLAIIKNRNQAKVLRGQRIDNDGETFTLTENDYNILTSAGYIRQASDALDRPDAPTAFDVTSAGWDWYLATHG